MKRTDARSCLTSEARAYRPSCPDGVGVWDNALGAWSCLMTQEDFSRTPCNSRSVSSGSRQVGFPSNSYQSQWQDRSRS